jgi:WD40 repeat protein
METPRPMTKQEAAAILSIDPQATADEVRRRYEQLYSDYQIRLTNAPTPSLKKVYQKNLQELQEAVQVLNGSADQFHADLPSIEPTYVQPKAQERQTASSADTAVELVATTLSEPKRRRDWARLPPATRIVIGPSLLTLLIYIITWCFAGYYLSPNKWGPRYHSYSVAFANEIGQPDGILFLVGVAWLPLVLGPYFGWKLERTGQGPGRSGRLFFTAAIIGCIAVLLSGLCMLLVLVDPSASLTNLSQSNLVRQLAGYALLLGFILGIVEMFTWKVLVKTLLTYACTSSVLVLIADFFVLTAYYQHLSVNEYLRSFLRFEFPTLLMFLIYPVPVGTLFGAVSSNMSRVNNRVLLKYVVAGLSLTGIVAVAGTYRFLHPDRSLFPGRPDEADHTIPGVSSLAFSPDGRWLAGRGDGVELWDMRTGEELHRLHVKAANPDAFDPYLAFSPDSRLIVTGEGTLWDVSSGQQLHDLSERAEQHHVWGPEFSLDGRWIATVVLGPGWQGKAITLWDVATGNEIRSLDSPIATGSVKFSRDGKWLAAASKQYDIIQLWDIASWQFRVFGTKGSHHGLTSVQIAFSPNGQLLAAAWNDGNTIRLWDVTSAKEFRTLTGSDVIECVAFSPDGRVLASGSPNGTVRFWEVATGKELRTLTDTQPVSFLAFSPDGRWLGSAGGHLKLWNLKDKR